MIYYFCDMRVFFLEGNIGAGKSTIMDEMKSSIKNNSIMFVQEPVNEWQTEKGGNLLDLYYSDPKRWSFAMQINCYASRMRLLKDSIKEAEIQNKMAVVFERSVLSDKLFANVCLKNMTMSVAEYSLYIKWATYLSSEYMPKVDGLIYFRVPPSVCQSRIQQRDRSEETSISLEYLTDLDHQHENWLGMKNSDPGAPVYIIDASSDDAKSIAKLALKYITNS